MCHWRLVRQCSCPVLHVALADEPPVAHALSQWHVRYPCHAGARGYNPVLINRQAAGAPQCTGGARVGRVRSRTLPETDMSAKEIAPQPPRNVEIIVGALAVMALVNLVMVLVFGGYDLTLLGVRIRSSTPARPLYILVGLLAGRMALSFRAHGFKSSLRTLVPWGIAMLAAGTAVFFYIIHSAVVAVPLWGVAVVWALTVAAAAAAWLSWKPGRPVAVAAVVLVLYLPLSAALANSLGYVKAWKRAFRIVTSEFDPEAKVPADMVGLLDGKGTDVEFRKVNVGNEWRNAADVAPGGFFSADAAVPAGARVTFFRRAERRRYRHRPRDGASRERKDRPHGDAGLQPRLRQVDRGQPRPRRGRRCPDRLRVRRPPARRRRLHGLGLLRQPPHRNRCRARIVAPERPRRPRRRASRRPPLALRLRPPDDSRDRQTRRLSGRLRPLLLAVLVDSSLGLEHHDLSLPVDYRRHRP